MNDNGKEPTPLDKSMLMLEFHAPGSAEFSMKVENVTPAQMLAASAWLKWYALKAFDAAAQASSQNRIAVPGLVGVRQ